jgi:hypothetical protein
MTTPIDPRAEPPEQPKTAQLPAADRTAIQLSELKALIVAGQSAINERVDDGFRGVKADMDLLGGQFESLERDVRGLQSWRVRTEDRQAVASMRAKAPSSFDMEQDAKLAEVIIWRNGVDEKLSATATKDDLAKATDAQTTAIVGAISKAAASPLLKMIGTAILGILTGYAVSKGWIAK